MNMANTTTYLLLGNKRHSLSYASYKLAMLTAQLSIMALLVDVGYILFDLYYEVYHSWVLLSCAGGLSLASFVLNRRGHYLAAKLTLGMSTNLTIFVFSSIEPIETGLSFLFVICALGAMSTLGFEEKKLSILFVALPIVLFIFSIVIDLDLFTRGSFTTDYLRSNLIINFIATYTAATLIIYFLLSLNYYSERALRENEKRLNDKNEELVKVNKELDRFVYSASHDLRSPISSVRGLINLVRLSQNPHETKNYIDLMDKQLIGLNKFIDDIVLYSRNTRVAVKHDAIPIKELVVDILTSLQFYPGADQVNVTVNIPEETIVQSDPTRVKIVLANLISNAFKHANHQNENPFVNIDAVQDESHIHIRIADNGMGIEEQYLSQIFDMFFQANDKSEGSGLGLYIVKETLEKLQGEIQVQSECGKGTTFTVALPLRWPALPPA